MKTFSIDQSEAILNSEFIALVVVQDRRIDWANAAMHRLLGYEPGELIGQPTRNNFVDEETYEEFGREAYSAVAETGVYSGVFQQRRKDGSIGWFQFNISRLAGHADAMVGSIVDQTARQEALAALEVHRSVVQDQTEVIGRVLPDGTFRFVNEVYCRTFGKTPEELIGQRWQPVVHPDDLPMIESRLSEMSPGNPVVIIENRVFVSGGEQRWMQFINRGFFDADGQLKEIQSVGRDITSLKQTESSLRDSEERLQMALSGSGLALWDWDIPGRKVAAGGRWFELLGYAAGQLSDDEDAWMRLIHPDDLAFFSEKLSDNLRGDSANFESEHRLKHKEGHWVSVLAHGRVTLRDAEGNPVRMVGTLQDITQRKRLNEEGVDLLKQIERLIRASAYHSPVTRESGEALDQLTKRERQILVMIAEGMTSARIAGRLGVAVNTIISHRQKMMVKLGLHSTAEVIRFALDHNML